MKKFYENKEYFWEYDYAFGEDFLKSIFNDKYQRKYSLVGDGIFNLILLNNKIYDVNLKQTKAMLVSDGKKAFRDEDKDAVIAAIADGFNKLGIEYTINSGKYITFKIFDYIGKIEIVKKAAMPA
jgi:hypothetical protein